MRHGRPSRAAWFRPKTSCNSSSAPGECYFYPASVIYGLSHRIGHILGGTFGLPHSVTSCITLAPVIRACADAYGDKFGIFASGTGHDTAAARLANRIANVVDALELPSRLSAFDFDRAKLPEVAALLQQNYPAEVRDLGDNARTEARRTAGEHVVMTNPELHPDHHRRDLLQSARAATQPAGLRQTLDALATRQVSATALAEQALEAAEASKRSVRAFSTIDWDRALKAAAESDRRYAESRQRPLEGLPIAIKDLIDTKGMETRYGSAAYLEALAYRRCRYREGADGAWRDPHRQDHDP